MRAKFRVSRIERFTMSVPYKDEQGVTHYRSEEVRNIRLAPVVGGSQENEAFYAATPTGEIVMGVVSEASARAFDLEKAYYVDFTPAED